MWVVLREPVERAFSDYIRGREFHLKEKDDFENALKIVRPSAMREVLVETPNISWNDIGGLENTKQSLLLMQDIV